MLRLIALMAVLPWLAPVLPSEVFEVLEASRPPQDLSISPEEYALRDLIPGWEPVRALTAEEMVRPWSPHQMRGGGFPRSAGDLWIPVVPRRWIADWPTPGAGDPIGVPRGWWWRPRDPAWHGAWVVLGAGARKSSFFTMVTTPLSESDYGSFGRARVIRSLYDAIRDREAARRGVDPLELDREARALEINRGMPSAAVEGMARARAMWREDRFEDAIELLERLLDEGAGNAYEQGLMRAQIADSYNKMGKLERAISAYQAARAYFESQRAPRLVSMLDDLIEGLEEMRPRPAGMEPMVRAALLVDSGNDPAARRWFEAALPLIDEDAEPKLAYDARAALAPVYERLGEHDKALSTARDALARAVELELDAEVAEMRALIARLE